MPTAMVAPAPAPVVPGLMLAPIVAVAFGSDIAVGRFSRCETQRWIDHTRMRGQDGGFENLDGRERTRAERSGANGSQQLSERPRDDRAEQI